LTRNPGVGALHYDKPGKPYELTRTDSGSTFPTYDADGNQTVRVGADMPGGRQQIAYTDFDLPTRVANGPAATPTSVTTYQYDANNVRTVEQVQNGPKTIYAGDLYRAVDQTPTSRDQVFRIPAPQGIVAEVTVTATGARSVRVLHTDHLGSTYPLAPPRIECAQHTPLRRRQRYLLKSLGMGRGSPLIAACAAARM